jgi:hypothetical protein
MEKLDVVFAALHRRPGEQHVAGQKPTGQLGGGVRLARRPGPLVIQHLMLGMNAHINLDLGIAAATVAPTPAQLEALHADFNRINDVLARLVRIVEDQLCTICPPLQRLAGPASRSRTTSSTSGMNAARDVAWKLAHELAAAPRDAWPGDHRQARRAVGGRRAALYPLHGLASATALAVPRHECKDIRWNIQVVAE